LRFAYCAAAIMGGDNPARLVIANQTGHTILYRSGVPSV
jgi:hypothetical protein